MFDRQLLLIDTDRSFEDSLRRHLATHRVAVHAAGDAATGARLARELMPDLVVVAVELPKREGFATYNKLRKTVGDKVPIAIVTASVPAADLEQHRELASGADAYLDRRALNATDLAAALAGLLRAHEVSSEEEVTLDMEDAEPTRVVSIHELASAPVADLVDGAVGDPIGNPLAGLDDAEADAAFAAISSGSAPKSRPFSFEDRLTTQVRALGGAADELGLDELPPERVESTELRNAPVNPGKVGNLVALEQENAKLRHDLDAARAATGAPVSREKDFKHLRDLIAQKDRDADELRDELEHREQDIKSGRDKVKLLTQKQKEHETSLLETEEQLVETRASLGQTTAERAAGLEREKGLRTRIDAGLQEIKLAHEEATGLKRRHVAAAQAAGEELDTERLAHERSRAGAAERIAALEAQSTAELEALDGQRQAQLAGQRRELEEQRMVALADAER
ncbi:MAG: response regulator, partial [Myxococcales bacterium]|nr:response regulator [Myxococcales bacterium]